MHILHDLLKYNDENNSYFEIYFHSQKGLHVLFNRCQVAFCIDITPNWKQNLHTKIRDFSYFTFLIMINQLQIIIQH